MAQRLLGRYLVGLVVGASFLLGLLLPARSLSAQGGFPERIAGVRASAHELEPVSTYTRALGELKDRFYGELPTDRKLEYAAVRGLVRSVDDYFTSFLDPEEYKQLHDDNEGEFVGIGAMLYGQKTREGYVRIDRPLSGTPAMKAGILKGDIITRVDGKPVNDPEITSVDQVVKMIRGEPDTTVRITIQRPGKPQPIEFKIVRQPVEIEVVQEPKLLEGNIGYFFLTQFNQRADEKVTEAVEQLKNKGMKGLIIDLRGNPGGLLDSAIDLVSRFVPPGNNAVIIVEAGGHEEPKRVNPRKYLRPDYPIVVLVNHTSASASEIFAGAMKDTHSGIIMGQTTYGKGLVQTLYQLPEDEAAVKITTHKYLTSNGHDINRSRDHRGGVEPDVAVEVKEEDFLKGKDTQLQKAVELLQQRTGYVRPAAQPAPAPVNIDLDQSPRPDRQPDGNGGHQSAPDPGAPLELAPQHTPRSNGGQQLQPPVQLVRPNPSQGGQGAKPVHGGAPAR